MNSPLALIVDDEPDILELLDLTLARMGVKTHQAADLASARALLEQHRFDLCLTDMRLPDGNGIELVEQIGRRLPVAVITAHGNMESAIQSLKAGAFDFVSKPVDLEILRRLVRTALKLLPDESSSQDGGDALLLGSSQAIERIRQMTRKLARSQAPVHISGESGTGKELAARLIHRQGPRADGRFVAVNCGAIPQELMESELFGHKKGSFTGAVADNPGLFQSADGGTLFLDEVADLPLSMQVKLLRVIQERTVRPVGAAEEIAIDVRIISATHKDLAAMVEADQFRQDLFYRINVIELHIPPLRERPEDIPLLAEQILARLAQATDHPQPDLEPAALKRLQQHPFPGNVRELENLLERATALSDGDQLTVDELILPSTPPPAGAGGGGGEGVPLEERLEELERDIILQALEETRWNRTAAAKKSVLASAPCVTG